MPTTHTPAAPARGKSDTPPAYQQGKVVHLYLPESPDLEAILTAAGRPEWLPYAQWFVSCLCYKRVVRGLDDDAWFGLSRKYITRHIPINIYSELLATLRAAGAVERTDFYQFWKDKPDTPGTCYQWRLGGDHRGADVRVTRLEHTVLFRNTQRVRQEKYQEDLARQPHLGRLRHWFDRVTVADGAPTGRKAFRSFREGHTWFELCEYGRLHTNLTSTPRELRRYYLLDGKPIASVDIACAQPLLVGLTLRQKYGKGEYQGHPRTEERPRNIRAGSGPIIVNSSEPLALIDFGRDSGSISLASLDAFVADCAAGVMYERLMAVSGLDRDAVKRKFMRWAYDRPHQRPDAFARAVERCYPALAFFVRRYYREHHYWDFPRKMYRKDGTLKKMVKKSRLPLDMQRAESELMVGLACRLAATVPLVTIHDCFGTHAEHLPAVTEAIRGAWLERFGVAPRLKEERWTPPGPDPARTGPQASLRRGEPSEATGSHLAA